MDKPNPPPWTHHPPNYHPTTKPLSLRSSQAILYAYYGAVALLLRATSPPLASMGAQEAALGGSFRRAHQRLATHAEEVAFNDPPAGHTEQMILNQHLWRLLRHARLSALLHFVQNSLDGYVVKCAVHLIL